MAKIQYDYIKTESGTYKTTLNKMELQRKPWEPVNPKLIPAFMPGTIGKIAVKKGQKVKEGDELLIFTAMKMDNRILAPMDGKIKSVNAKTGENVAKNTVLIELE